MKLETRRIRSGRSRQEGSPESSIASKNEPEEEAADRFALERQVARDLFVSKTSPDGHRKHADAADLEPEEQAAEPTEDADGNIGRSSRSRYSDRATKIQHTDDGPDKVLQRRKSSMRTYRRTQGSNTSTSNGSDSKSDSLSVSTRSTETNSVKSETSTRSTIRTSGRRSKPSTKISGVPHKDASEADSLSFHSSLDTHSTSSLHENGATGLAVSRESLMNGNGRRVSCDSRKTEILEDDSVTRSSPLASPSTTRSEAPVAQDVYILAPIPQHPSSAAPSSPPPEEDALKATMIINKEAEAAEAPEEVKHGTHAPFQRRLSSSSFSSDLSDLASVSSEASGDSRLSRSTTGSNTIRRLAESQTEEERRSIMAAALELTKSWRASWLLLDKKVKANAKKQERNRAARQAAAATQGKRKR